MDITKILNKALGISKNTKFKVLSYNKESEHMEYRDLTYLQLGTELIVNCSEIKEVHIIYKDDKSKLECNKCNSYGSCDHEGSYQKNGKWCYDD